MVARERAGACQVTRQRYHREGHEHQGDARRAGEDVPGAGALVYQPLVRLKRERNHLGRTRKQ